MPDLIAFQEAIVTQDYDQVVDLLGPEIHVAHQRIRGADGWPFRRIDYILVRCGEHAGATLEIERCERVFSEPVAGGWASDHFGVLADLRSV